MSDLNFGAMAQVSAEGRTPFLGEGEHLVSLVSASYGPTKGAPNISAATLIVKVVASSSPELTGGEDRTIRQDNSGKWGLSYLMQTVKGFCCAVAGIAPNDPSVNGAANTPEAAAAGALIEKIWTESCKGDASYFRGKVFKIVSQPAMKDGAVTYSKDGTAFQNHSFHVAPEGWTPSKRPLVAPRRAPANQPALFGGVPQPGAPAQPNPFTPPAQPAAVTYGDFQGAPAAAVAQPAPVGAAPAPVMPWEL